MHKTGNTFIGIKCKRITKKSNSLLPSERDLCDQETVDMAALGCYTVAQGRAKTALFESSV